MCLCRYFIFHNQHGIYDCRGQSRTIRMTNRCHCLALSCSGEIRWSCWKVYKSLFCKATWGNAYTFLCHQRKPTRTEGVAAAGKWDYPCSPLPPGRGMPLNINFNSMNMITAAFSSLSGWVNGGITLWPLKVLGHRGKYGSALNLELSLTSGW